MADTSHFWAIGYDDIGRASAVRDEITHLAWDPGHAGKYLILEDAAVVMRHPDGSFTLDREPFPGIANVLSCSAAGFLAGLVVAAPLTGAAIGAFIGGAGTLAWAAQSGIGADFIQQVEKLMRPGTSEIGRAHV
jgi:uncharacterized membrane protein